MQNKAEIMLQRCHKQKLNAKKPEFISFESHCEHLKYFAPVNVLREQLTPTETIKNLDVRLNSDLSFSIFHVWTISK